MRCINSRVDAPVCAARWLPVCLRSWKRNPFGRPTFSTSALHLTFARQLPLRGVPPRSPVNTSASRWLSTESRCVRSSSIKGAASRRTACGRRCRDVLGAPKGALPQGSSTQTTCLLRTTARRWKPGWACRVPGIDREVQGGIWVRCRHPGQRPTRGSLLARRCHILNIGMTIKDASARTS